MYDGNKLFYDSEFCGRGTMCKVIVRLQTSFPCNVLPELLKLSPYSYWGHLKFVSLDGNSVYYWRFIHSFTTVFRKKIYNKFHFFIEKLTLWCDIWCSHDGGHQGYGFVRCYDLWFYSQMQTLWRNQQNLRWIWISWHSWMEAEVPQ